MHTQTVDGPRERIVLSNSKLLQMTGGRKTLAKGNIKAMEALVENLRLCKRIRSGWLNTTYRQHSKTIDAIMIQPSILLVRSLWPGEHPRSQMRKVV